MRRYNSIYYLLFILLIMGAFAAMAQNRYGLRIIGVVGFAFSLMFLLSLVSLLRRNQKPSVSSVVELVCLAVVALIFGLRVFYIYFPFVEWIFVAACAGLIIIYSGRMMERYKFYRARNTGLGGLVLVYHAGLVLSLVCLVLAPFFPRFSEMLSVLAFIFLLVFLAAGILNKNYLVEGQEITSFSILKNFRDHSVLIAIFFSLFFLYFGLNRLGVIPAIYSDEFPRAYYELVNQSGSEKEKSADNKYKYELFKEKYDEFIKRVEREKN